MLDILGQMLIDSIKEDNENEVNQYKAVGDQLAREHEEGNKTITKGAALLTALGVAAYGISKLSKNDKADAK